MALVLGGLVMLMFLFWMGSGSHQKEREAPVSGGTGPAGVERRIALPPAEVAQPGPFPAGEAPLAPLAEAAE